MSSKYLPAKFGLKSIKLGAIPDNEAPFNITVSVVIDRIYTKLQPPCIKLMSNNPATTVSAEMFSYIIHNYLIQIRKCTMLTFFLFSFLEFQKY